MSSHRRAMRAGVAVLALVLGIGACEGSNLFEGEDPVSATPPEILQVTAPFSVTVPTTVQVEIRAIAERGLDEVLVQYSGALTDDQPFGFDGQTSVVTINSTLDIDTALDSLLILRVTATDVGGRSSDAVLDTIRVN